MESLEKRMKNNYESRFKFFLPRRTYAIIRIDGKAFHTYTKGMKRPFDDQLMNNLDETARYLCEQIQGARFAYVQSDEISILLTDFETENTEAWFDGNVQKISSVSASLATAYFNFIEGDDSSIVCFDSRCFVIPSFTEVMNYFVWRQKDAVRNSISLVAQSLYSHNQLHGKDINQMQEMCWQLGINWNDYSPKYKRGRIIRKFNYTRNGAERSYWNMEEPSTFTQDRNYLTKLIPNIRNYEN